MMPDARVFAPAATLAELRTITPVIGSPPTAPETILAAPCPISSLSRLLLLPVAMRSTASAVSRLSTLAISATVITPIANAPHRPSGRLGSCRASSSEPPSSIRGTFGANTAATAVATTTATNGPGTGRNAAGVHRHPTRMAITRMPIAIPAVSA